MSPDALGKVMLGKSRHLRGDNLARLARVLNVSESWLLGTTTEADPMPTDAGFGESEAIPLHAGDALGPAQSRWEVAPRHDAPQGFRAGDLFVLDQSLEPRTGDDVLATIVDRNHPRGKTILRSYRNGWLYGGPATQPELVDNARVAILGVVIRSWRDRR